MSNFREANEIDYWDSVNDAFGGKARYTGKRHSSVLKQIQRNAGPAGLRLSTDWWKKQVKALGAVDEKSLYMSEKKMARSNVMVGKLYMFFYDPKHKKTLPYYDKFPLTWIFARDKNYFYGINMHYLPIKHRIRLLDKFQMLAADSRYDARTKLIISWEILKNFSKYPEVKPCVKMYLRSHVRSKFILVHPRDWLTATLLPVEQFSKKSKNAVWADSRIAIKNAKKAGRPKTKAKAKARRR